MVRHLAAKVSHNLLGSRLHIADSAIVAQPLPEIEQGLFWCLSQVGHCGQGRHKTLVIGNNSSHLGLLQHNLADPDGIGILTLTPGQITFIFIVPS